MRTLRSENFWCQCTGNKQLRLGPTGNSELTQLLTVHTITVVGRLKLHMIWCEITLNIYIGYAVVTQAHYGKSNLMKA